MYTLRSDFFNILLQQKIGKQIYWSEKVEISNIYAGYIVTIRSAIKKYILSVGFQKFDGHASIIPRVSPVQLVVRSSHLE